MRRDAKRTWRGLTCCRLVLLLCGAAGTATAAEPPAAVESAQPAAATPLDARIQQADLPQVQQEVQSLFKRIRIRRAELQRQPELAKLVAASRQAQGAYRQKLEAQPDYAAAEKKHADQAARFKTLSAEVRDLRAHFVNHRTAALAADFPMSQRLGRVKDCVYCEEAYGKNPAGDPELFRRQNETYLASAAQYRELRRATVVWPQQIRELTEKLCKSDAELNRLAQAAEQAGAAVERALAADPALSQLKAESERWQRLGEELRKAAAAPAAKPAEAPAK